MSEGTTNTFELRYLTGKIWCARVDSNHWPFAPEASSVKPQVACFQCLVLLCFASGSLLGHPSLPANSPNAGALWHQ